MELHAEKSLGMEEENIGVQLQSRKQRREGEIGRQVRGLLSKSEDTQKPNKKLGVDIYGSTIPIQDRDSRIARMWASAAYLRFSEILLSQRMRGGNRIPKFLLLLLQEHARTWYMYLCTHRYTHHTYMCPYTTHIPH